MITTNHHHNYQKPDNRSVPLPGRPVDGAVALLVGNSKVCSVGDQDLVGMTMMMMMVMIGLLMIMMTVPMVMMMLPLSASPISQAQRQYGPRIPLRKIFSIFVIIPMFPNRVCWLGWCLYSRQRQGAPRGRPELLLLFSLGLDNCFYFHSAWIIVIVIFTRPELLFLLFSLGVNYCFFSSLICINYFHFDICVLLYFVLCSRLVLFFLLLFLMIIMLTLLFSSIAQKMADRTKLSSCNKYFELKKVHL